MAHAPLDFDSSQVQQKIVVSKHVKLADALRADYIRMGRDLALLKVMFDSKSQHWKRLERDWQKLPYGELSVSNAVAWLSDPTCSDNSLRLRYNILILFPSLLHLASAKELKPLKKRWFESNPKHTMFFDVNPLITATPFDLDNEELLRERIIMAAAIQVMARSIDTERWLRKYQLTEGKMLCYMRRKGKTKYSTVIFHPKTFSFGILLC